MKLVQFLSAIICLLPIAWSLPINDQNAISSHPIDNPIDFKKPIIGALKTVGGFAGTIADSTPLVGHAKALFHKITHQDDQARLAMHRANRNSAIICAGLIDSSPLSGACAGIAFDYLYGDGSSKDPKECPAGVWKALRDHKEKKLQPQDALLTCLTTGLDGMGSSAAKGNVRKAWDNISKIKLPNFGGGQA